MRQKKPTMPINLQPRLHFATKSSNNLKEKGFLLQVLCVPWISYLSSRADLARKLAQSFDQRATLSE